MFYSLINVFWEGHVQQAGMHLEKKKQLNSSKHTHTQARVRTHTHTHKRA